MSRPNLSVLIVEDNPDDVELLLRALARNFEVDHQRVQDANAMRAALLGASWDLVLSDYSLPAFSALSALGVLRESGQDLPFIVVSGTIGEETAIAALTAGAHDFVSKGNLARLVPAIERECREAESRRQRRLAEQQLRESELKYRRIVETTREGIWVVDQNECTSYVNQRLAVMLGSTPEKLLGRSFLEFVAENWRASAREYPAQWRRGVAGQHELELERADHSEFWISMSTVPILDDAGHYAGALFMVTDTTEQRKLQAQLMMSD
ncbi:MAG TPA: PAS domain S-box protein, partial [Polyangiaceae bacterium]|nr:PAS domain S-box protein [Polyangiaceae bacterium]